jgi:hypothetical protein
MIGLKKKGPPDRPFSHVEDCRILRNDPSVSIPWSYDGDGLWRRVCQCTVEYHREPITAGRVRNDPRSRSLARHAGECRYVNESDPAQLQVLLKVKDGAAGGYWWVECGSCTAGWQVPYYAAEVVR